MFEVIVAVHVGSELPRSIRSSTDSWPNAILIRSCRLTYPHFFLKKYLIYVTGVTVTVVLSRILTEGNASQ